MNYRKTSSQLLRREVPAQNDSPTTETTKALRAETRYIADFGISFILRRNDALEHEVLAEVGLVFDDVAGNCCAQLFPSMR